MSDTVIEICEQLLMSAGSAPSRELTADFDMHSTSGGTRESFEALARQHLPFLSREAAKYVPFSEVDDVVQETLIRVYRSIAAYQEQGKFQFWLKKILTRVCLDYWRQQKRQKRTRDRVDFERIEATANPGDDAIIRRDLERCLNSLNPTDRIVCIMAFLEERSHREIATVLGTTVVAVKVRCFRLRTKLKSWFLV